MKSMMMEQSTVFEPWNLRPVFPQSSADCYDWMRLPTFPWLTTSSPSSSTGLPPQVASTQHLPFSTDVWAGGDPIRQSVTTQRELSPPPPHPFYKPFDSLTGRALPSWSFDPLGSGPWLANPDMAPTSFDRSLAPSVSMTEISNYWIANPPPVPVPMSADSYVSSTTDSPNPDSGEQLQVRAPSFPEWDPPNIEAIMEPESNDLVLNTTPETNDWETDFSQQMELAQPYATSTENKTDVTSLTNYGTFELSMDDLKVYFVQDTPHVLPALEESASSNTADLTIQSSSSEDIASQESEFVLPDEALATEISRSNPEYLCQEEAILDVINVESFSEEEVKVEPKCALIDYHDENTHQSMVFSESELSDVFTDDLCYPPTISMPFEEEEEEQVECALSPVCAPQAFNEDTTDGGCSTSSGTTVSNLSDEELIAPARSPNSDSDPEWNCTPKENSKKSNRPRRTTRTPGRKRGPRKQGVKAQIRKVKEKKIRKKKTSPSSGKGQSKVALTSFRYKMGPHLRTLSALLEVSEMRFIRDLPFEIIRKFHPTDVARTIDRAINISKNWVKILESGQNREVEPDWELIEKVFGNLPASENGSGCGMAGDSDGRLRYKTPFGQSTAEGIKPGLISIRSDFEENGKLSGSPEIMTTVGSAELQVHLDLYKIAEKCDNTEMRRPDEPLLMRLKQPKCTGYLNEDGRLVVVGAKSYEDFRMATRRFARIVQKTGAAVKLSQLQVHFCVGIIKLPFDVNVEAMMKHEHLSKFIYGDLGVFSGVVFRMRESPILTVVFNNGVVIMTEALGEEDMRNTLNKIYPTLRLFGYQ